MGTETVTTTSSLHPQQCSNWIVAMFHSDITLRIHVSALHRLLKHTSMSILANRAGGPGFKSRRAR